MNFGIKLEHRRFPFITVLVKRETRRSFRALRIHV